ncbi:MAG TPA: DUF167 family protein [Moraxellaceae bacterium]|nr:DUF167 family protein [Moraxellaceae bacterium]
MSAPVRHEADAVTLVLHAQPGARESAFAGLHGEALKVRLAAPAQEGKANRELCRFLAEAFGVPLAAVELLSGESSRHKRVKIRSPRAWPPALAAWQ